MWFGFGKHKAKVEGEDEEEEKHLVSTSQAEASEFENAEFTKVQDANAILWEEQSAPLQLKAEVSDVEKAEIVVQYMGEGGVEETVVVSLFASWPELYQLLLATNKFEMAHAGNRDSVEIGPPTLFLFQTPLVKGTALEDTFKVEIAKHREKEETQQKQRFAQHHRMTKACTQRDEDPDEHSEKILAVCKRFDITGEGSIRRQEWDEVMQYTRLVNDRIGDGMSWYRYPDGREGLWIEGVALEAGASEAIAVEQMELVLWKFPDSNLFEILDIPEPEKFAKERSKFENLKAAAGVSLKPKVKKQHTPFAQPARSKAAPSSPLPGAASRSKKAPSRSRPGSAAKAKATSTLQDELVTESTATPSSSPPSGLPKKAKAKSAQSHKLAPKSEEAAGSPDVLGKVDGKLRPAPKSKEAKPNSESLVKVDGKLRSALKANAGDTVRTPPAAKKRVKSSAVLAAAAGRAALGVHKAAAKAIDNFKYEFAGQVESV